MAEDAGGLTIACLPLLSYARCKGEWDAYSGDSEKMSHWKGSETLGLVERNTFESRKLKLEHRKHTEPVEGCRYCRQDAERKKKGA